MEKRSYCDRCGTLMNYEIRKDLKGGTATTFTCTKCYYRYEQGLRYNPAIKQYISYYKYS